MKTKKKQIKYLLSFNLTFIFVFLFEKGMGAEFVIDF